MSSATAQANPNIAFIKYWGDQDSYLHIPANGSISMNLDSLYTKTQVSFNPELPHDTLFLNGTQLTGPPLARVVDMLEFVRQKAGIRHHATVVSENNFPAGAGIASSASAFAALSLAASTAAGLKLSESELSRLARIAVINTEHKKTGSTQGHALAETSPLQPARVKDTPRRLDICRHAILERDFDTFADIIELDSNMMHAVIMTSTPTVLYWQAKTIALMHAVTSWRAEGLQVGYTIDAGPNIHILTTEESSSTVISRLTAMPGIQYVLTARPGGAARLI
jgi:diphosphomevalonate decarboxylase